MGVSSLSCDYLMIKPYFEVLLAAAIWGSSGVFVKSMACEPVVITFFRLAIPPIFLIIYSVIAGKKLFRNISKEMWIASFLNALGVYLFILAFSMTAIGNVTIILYTWPIFATILSIIFLKEKAKRRTLVLLTAAFVGILLVFIDKDFSFSDQDFVAMLAVLAAAFLSAIAVVMFKKGLETYSPVQTVFYQNMIGGVVYLPFLIIHAPIPLKDSIIGISYGMIIGVVACLLFFSALRTIAPSKAFTLTYFEVVIAIILGRVFFNETLPLNAIVGGLIIISSIVLLKRN